MKMRVDLKYTPYKPFFVFMLLYIGFFVFVIIKPYNQYYNAYMMYFYIAIVVMTIVFICFIWQIYLYVSLRISDFKQFMVLNNLYKRFPDNVQEVVNTSQGLSMKPVVTYQVGCFVEMKKIENELRVCYLLDGSKQSELTHDLQSQLSYMLNKSLKTIEYTVRRIGTIRKKSYIEYVFYMKSVLRLKIIDQNYFDNRKMYDPIKLDQNNEWDFSKFPHALITGDTGSGKTFFLFYLDMELKQRNATLIYLDPKGLDVEQVAKISSAECYVTPSQIAGALRRSVEEMERRSNVFKEQEVEIGRNYQYYGLEPYFVLFDEISASLISADKKTRGEIESYYTQIILKGRQYGVFMILLTQRPDASVISGDVRDNLSLRVALGDMSSIGHRMMFDDKGTDLKNVRQQEGYFYIGGTGMNVPAFFETPQICVDINKLYANLLKTNKDS